MYVARCVFRTLSDGLSEYGSKEILIGYHALSCCQMSIPACTSIAVFHLHERKPDEDPVEGTSSALLAYHAPRPS